MSPRSRSIRRCLRGSGIGRCRGRTWPTLGCPAASSRTPGMRQTHQTDMSTRRCATPAPTSGAGPTTKRMRLGHTGRAASRCRAEGERRRRRVGTRSRPATALMVPQENRQCNENLARCRVAIDTWSARPASWRRCWRSRAGSGAAFRRSAAWGCAVTSAPPVDRDRLVESLAELRAELAEATAARERHADRLDRSPVQSEAGRPLHGDDQAAGDAAAHLRRPAAGVAPNAENESEIRQCIH